MRLPINAQRTHIQATRTKLQTATDLAFPIPAMTLLIQLFNMIALLYNLFLHQYKILKSLVAIM